MRRTDGGRADGALPYGRRHPGRLAQPVRGEAGRQEKRAGEGTFGGREEYRTNVPHGAPGDGTVISAIPCRKHSPHPRSNLATVTDTVGIEPGRPVFGEPDATRQPKGLWLLFMVEMWERFSYYGMRALLVLYLVNALKWSTADASRLYGNYTALVYLTPVIGGWLADRFIGTRRSLVIGGAIIALGHFSMAYPSMTMFYVGLGLIIVGTGFFKSNVSTMVGQLYRQGDPRRDAGFTIFYMGVNTGAFLAPLVCGYLAQNESWGNWHYGFAAAGVGMVLGLITFLWGRDRYLPGIGLRAQDEVAREKKAQSAPLTREERHRVIAIFIVAFFVVFFWAAFEQAGASMNLFADKNTNNTLLGFHFPSSWYQSVNPAAIIVFGIVFAGIWTGLAARGREPSTPVKMAVGLFFLSAGFLVLVFGAAVADTGVKVSPAWLIAAYTLHTLGELCLSPVGLSLVTKLAPVKYASMLMGVWFLANFVANKLAGELSARMGEFASLQKFFTIFVVEAAVAGVVLLLISPFLKKLMHGRG
ncbi:MAG: di-/tripeptide transporter [Gemmatimonadetes bacterium]|nr:di-/tripeptide transporter [Gemmatimonadota bacterium]